MPKVYEFLTKERWTTIVAARNKTGMPVRVGHPDAVTFCFLGALEKCYPKSEIIGLQNKIREELTQRGEPISIGRFNDTHGYEAVVELAKQLDI